MDEAARQSLQVLIGLSRTGDLYLLPDYENSLRPGGVLRFPGRDMNSRFTAAEYYTKATAKDLYEQYGHSPAFAGWFLTHETDCLDVGMRYFQPMGQYLKGLSPGKKVGISPHAEGRVCFSNTPSGSISYFGIVDANKAWIDTYAYQDSLGAASLTMADTYYSAYAAAYYGKIFNIFSTTPYTGHLAVVNYFTDAARYQRIGELNSTGRLLSLKQMHAQTGTWFWMNTVGWEMNGICPKGTPTPAPGNPNARYGCAYAGPWSRLQVQLDTWNQYTPHLMLNEGFALKY